MNTKEQFEQNLNKINKQNNKTNNPSSFKLVICAIVSVHVAIVAAFLLFGTKTTQASPAIDEPKYVGTNSTEQQTADQQFLDQQIPMDGFTANSTVNSLAQNTVSKPVDELPKETPKETPKEMPKAKSAQLPAKSSKDTPKLLETYVVKKGDTLYSISRKYKLNFKKLLELNKIKDPNKLNVGQKIKFL